jgi:adenylate kinase family enzyme
MTNIFVSALIVHKARALLGCTANGKWELPTEPLGEVETVEDALGRLLAKELGLVEAIDEFLDTYYERGSESTNAVVRNVFRVHGVSEQVDRASSRYSELRWVELQELGNLEISEAQRAILREPLGDVMSELLPGAPITILTGPAGAGKSTIAGLLCAQLHRSAHIEVDLLREMIISGYASPIPGEADALAAAEQIRLGATNAAALARNFSLAGFEVVIDDTIETPGYLDVLLSELTGIAPVSFFTLMPDVETLRERDSGREPDLQLGQRCLDLRAILERNGEARGLSLDNSQMSKSETVSWILANRENARVL